MDPNAALATILANVALILSEGGEVSPELAYDTAEAFDNLHAWLSRGGFLPSAWQR